MRGMGGNIGPAVAVMRNARQVGQQWRHLLRCSPIPAPHSVRPPSGYSGRTGSYRRSPGRRSAAACRAAASCHSTAPKSSRASSPCRLRSDCATRTRSSRHRSRPSPAGSAPGPDGRRHGRASCPSARSRQAIARSRSSTSAKISDRLTRCSGLLPIQPDGFLAGGQRLLHAVGDAAQRTEMRVPGGVAGTQLDRAAQQTMPCSGSPGHRGDDTAKGQRRRMVRRAAPAHRRRCRRPRADVCLGGRLCPRQRLFHGLAAGPRWRGRRRAGLRPDRRPDGRRACRPRAAGKLRRMRSMAW